MELPVRLQKTVKIAEVLETALSIPNLAEELAARINEDKSQEAVAWRTVKDACCALRGNGYDTSPSPWMGEVCRGSKLALPAPVSRARHPELVARLKKLQEAQDELSYQGMVKDITRAEREGDEKRNSLLPTTKLQLSFGLHVIVTMGTFYALGMYALRAVSDSPTVHALGGILGLVVALLIETVLFMVKFSKTPEGGKKYLKYLQPHVYGSDGKFAPPPGALLPPRNTDASSAAEGKSVQKKGGKKESKKKR